MLIIVVLVVVLLLLLGLLLPVLVVAEAPIQVLVWPIDILSALGAAAAGRLRAIDSITPAACRIASVHLREQEAQDSLSVGPIKVIELDCDLLLRLSGRVLGLKVLFGELAARFNQREELRLLCRFLASQISLELASLLFFHLFH